MTDEQNLIAQFGQAFRALEEMGFEVLKPLSPEAVAELTEKLLADSEIAAEAERIARSFGPIANLHALVYQRLDDSQRHSASILALTLAVLRPFLAEPIVRNHSHASPRQAVDDDPAFRHFGLEGLPDHIKATVVPDVLSDAAIVKEANRVSLSDGHRTDLCLLICKRCEAASHPVRLIDVRNIAIALIRQSYSMRADALQDLRADPTIMDKAKKVAQTDCPRDELSTLIHELCADKRHTITSGDVEKLAEILIMNFSGTPGVIVSAPPENAF